MLKIKDNVPLKELEKFGFEYKKKTSSNSELYEWIRETPYNYDYVCVFIWNRNITDSGATDKLYDLIQAGLVEKVEG